MASNAMGRAPVLPCSADSTRSLAPSNKAKVIWPIGQSGPATIEPALDDAAWLESDRCGLTCRLFAHQGSSCVALALRLQACLGSQARQQEPPGRAAKPLPYPPAALA